MASSVDNSDSGLPDWLDATIEEAFSRSNGVEIDCSQKNIGPRIAEAVVLHLAMRMPQLRSLNLAHNGLGDAGMLAIAIAIRSSPHLSLAILNLEDNQIGDEGLIALVDAIQSTDSRSMADLYLKNNQIGETGAIELAKAILERKLPLLKYVDLENNKLSIEGDLLRGGSAIGIASAILRKSLQADAKDTRNETQDGQSEVSGRFRTGAPTADADEPASVDCLNREPWLMALAAMFASPRQGTPFTLALFGDWGGGKSSLLRMLKERLIKYEMTPGLVQCDFAEFNAWQYEKTDNVAAGLAQEVVKGLVEGATPPVDGKLPSLPWVQHCWWMNGWRHFSRRLTRFRLALNFAASEHGWRMYRFPIGLMVLALITLVGWWWPAIPEQIAASIPEWLKGTRGGIAAAVPALVGWFVMWSAALWTLKSLSELLEHPMSVELHTFLQLPGYKQHLGTVPVLKQQIRTLCGMRLGTQGKRQRRLVVFVDDLDRCSPETIVSTLEAVRLVMDLPNVIVLIAIDPRIALQAVGYHYQKLASKENTADQIAREYLSKIIQLSVHLPQLKPDEVKQFVDKKLFEGLAPGKVGNLRDENPHRQTEHTGVLTGSTKKVAPNNSGETLRNPFPGMPISSPEPPPEPQPIEPIEQALQLQTILEDSEDDKNWFIECMNECLANCLQRSSTSQFLNPRRLLRLKNAYRLLKVVANRSKVPVDHKQLMQALFTVECNRMTGMESREVNEDLAAIVDAVVLPKILQVAESATD